MNGNSKSRPVIFGCHSSCSAPWGKYTSPRRGLGAAGVCASTVAAGIMASSSGRARVAPAPFRTARRDRCFLNTNMIRGLSFPRLLDRRCLQGCRLARGFSLAEGIARDDAEDDRLETVIVGRRLPYDAAHRRHVAIVEAATEGV